MNYLGFCVHLTNSVFRGVWIGLLGLALLTGCSDSPNSLLEKAKQDIANNDLKAATINLRNALQKDASHKEARFVLGNVLRQTGDMLGAEKEYRRAMELGYDKERVVPMLAQTLFALGRYDDFGKDFGNVELTNPDANAELKALKGSVHLLMGRADEASTLFDQALALKPDASMAKVGKARVAALRGDLQTAENVIAEILAKSPKHREALTFKSALVAQKGDREGVFQIRKSLAEYYPDGVGEQYAYAVALLERGKIDEATNAGNTLAKLAPRDPRTLHVQALNAFQRKDYTVAQELAVKALARAPDFAPAQLVAGAASLQLRSYQQAIQHLSAVATTQKTNAYARQLLVAAYIGAGDTERAAKELKSALEVLPNDSKLLLMAGELAISKRDIKEATKFFELSAEQKDDTGLANLRLGQAHLAAGDEEEGLRILEETAGSAGKNIRSDLALVSHHLRRGQFDKALKWVDSVESKRAGDPLGPSLRGIVLAMKQDIAGARKQFEVALQRDPAHVPSLEYMWRLDTLEKKYADTKARYETAMKKAPDNEILAIAYARVLLNAGDKPEAVIGYLQDFVKKHPSAQRAWLAIVDLHLRNKDTRQALSAAQTAAAAVPNSSAIRIALGRVQMAAGEMNQAIATFTEVSKAEDKSPQPLLMLADAYAASKNYSLALSALMKARERKPDYLPTLQAMVITHVRLQQNETALAIAKDIRNRFPNQTVGAELEAAVYVAMDRWNDAVELLERAYKLAPSVGLFTKLYEALNRAGKPAQADVLAAEWFKKNPKDAGVRVFLAERAGNEKKYDVSTRYYKEAIALQPKNAALLNNLAYMAALGNDPKAQSYAEEANALMPNSPAIMDTLGWILVQKGDTQKGLELLDKATKAAPDSLAIRFNLARALIKAGRKSDAKKELELIASKGDKFKQKAEVDALLREL